MEIRFGDNYLISTDKGLLNHEVIHRFLASSYWASKRPVEAIDKSIETSFLFWGLPWRPTNWLRSGDYGLGYDVLVV